MRRVLFGIGIGVFVFGSVYVSSQAAQITQIPAVMVAGTNQVTQAYYYRGRNYPYRYHGSYYRYHYHGH